METEFRIQTKQPNIISLIILSAFASMGAMIVTPALPEIAKSFHVSSGAARRCCVNS